MADNALAFHIVQDLASLRGRIVLVIQEGNEINNSPLELNVVFPKRVIGVEEKALRIIRIG
jgi:hypothetical protein